MDQFITEKIYPIEIIWVLKALLKYGLILIFLIPAFFIQSRKDTELVVNLILYIVFFIGLVIYAALRRATFHYFVEDKFLTLKQGILSRQQRHIPYGVIQNIFVKQDIFDRVFGLASLVLENASMGAGSQVEGVTKIFGFKVKSREKQRVEMVGFSGNKVSIPGLKKENAEALKGILLAKMKENPIEDSQSGL